ncbi:MAG: ergothioneine biosynthesis protein EgtB [Actinomycetota bacterium]
MDYATVRRESLARIRGLTPEDLQAQAFPDASPGKWHLAHTTWFFAEFILGEVPPLWRTLFNSYYEAVGPRHPRPERGLLTRPGLAEVLEWRAEVDARMAGRVSPLLALGLAHEQQHQELMVTDQLALFARHPAEPGWRDPPAPASLPSPGWIEHPGGPCEIGHGGGGFAFDNEGPRHRVWLQPFRLATRPLSNKDVAAFIADGGYVRPELWMSEGWDTVRRLGWSGPEYWRDGTQLTPAGRRPLDPDAAAVHLSWFEADAVARWAGARLPTEAEWEVLADRLPATGLVWEWTGSAYRPHPGYRPGPGALGEYNGKFMSGQMVLKGGSTATPAGHGRASYRNFFPPAARWQFTGARLAEDA